MKTNNKKQIDILDNQIDQLVYKLYELTDEEIKIVEGEGQRVMKKKTARAHHYIPEFYLAGFTDTGGKEGYLEVIDQETGKQWRTKPKNVANHRDFYRINLEEADQNLIEYELSKIESLAAPVIKKIITKYTLPNNYDYIVLMNFIALLLTRIPSFRNNINDFISDISKRRLKLITHSKKHWNSNKTKIKNNGYKFDSNVPYEDMKKFVDNELYKFKTENKFHNISMFKLLDPLIPLLLYRKWSLILSINSSYNFVCSDKPIDLAWSKKVSCNFSGPGFGLSNTEVTFPLSSNVVLYGIFEKNHGVLSASDKLIATINSKTCKNARQIFSSKKDFVWLKKNGSIGIKSELIEEINKNIGKMKKK